MTRQMLKTSSGDYVEYFVDEWTQEFERMAHRDLDRGKFITIHYHQYRDECNARCEERADG